MFYNSNNKFTNSNNKFTNSNDDYIVIVRLVMFK